MSHQTRPLRGPELEVLLSVQTALSMILLVGGVLLFTTWSNLRQVDPGFDPDALVALQTRKDTDISTDRHSTHGRPLPSHPGRRDSTRKGPFLSGQSPASSYRPGTRQKADSKPSGFVVICSNESKYLNH